MVHDANSYSDTWFSLFLRQMAPADTAREVEFLKRWIPLPHYRRVFDLCCGDGRHCELLASAGYEVTGVDRNEDAIAAARKRCLAGRFVASDMRDLSGIPGPFDAVLSLWQSFGYFDDETNARLLAGLRDRLAPKGRLILDIHNPAFFQANLGTRTFQKAGREIRETKSIIGNRLTVEVDYGNDTPPDRFDWRVYNPDELRDLAGTIGLVPLATCANFDEAVAPSSGSPRMQWVLEAMPR